MPGLGVLLLPHSPWWRVGTITKPEFLPSSQKVLSAFRKGSGQPLSCCPMTLKCFKQNRVDGGVLLRQLQGRGSQIQAAAGGLGLGLGTGKTKADQHLAAPGLAETVRRAAALLGKKSRSKTQGSKSPRGASGELSPAFRTWSWCCRQGRDAAAQPSAARLQPHLDPASSPLPNPATPSGRACKSHPSLESGHVLKEPLPLEASCQCIALWSLNTLLARTQATPSFLAPHIPPVLRWCCTCHGQSIPPRCRDTSSAGHRAHLVPQV